MDFNFTIRDMNLERIVFVLTLDRKKMTERIVIAETGEAILRLEQNAGNVFYDQTRPLGELLTGFEADPDRRWNANAARLHESYGKVFPFERARWKTVKPCADFLREKYESGEPSSMFAAIRTWEAYLNCFHMSHGPERFLERTLPLYKPFSRSLGLWQERPASALSDAARPADSQVELWYPAKKRPFECVAAYSSFQPLIYYYLHRIEEWRFAFQECKACGRIFLAKSRHREICGEGCRKAQAIEAKRKFDERAKGDMLERVHETAYYYWYNRLRKLKRQKEPDTEKIAAVAAAFEVFRAEAVKRKADVRQGEGKLADFSAWLIEQQDEIDRLTLG